MAKSRLGRRPLAGILTGMATLRIGLTLLGNILTHQIRRIILTDGPLSCPTALWGVVEYARGSGPRTLVMLIGTQADIDRTLHDISAPNFDLTPAAGR